MAMRRTRGLYSSQSSSSLNSYSSAASTRSRAQQRRQQGALGRTRVTHGHSNSTDSIAETEPHQPQSIITPLLSEALNAVSEVSEGIATLDFDIITVDQQEELANVIFNHVETWQVKLERAKQYVKERREFELKMKLSAEKNNTHPRNLRNTHWVFPGTSNNGISKFLLLFADGSYHMVEGCEVGPEHTHWYRRYCGSWQYQPLADMVEKKSFRGRLVISEERSTERFTTAEFDHLQPWNKKQIKMNQPISRDWHKIGGAYNYNFTDDRLGGGSWKKLKLVNASPEIYNTAFGNDHLKSIRLAGFEVPAVSRVRARGGRNRDRERRRERQSFYDDSNSTTSYSTSYSSRYGDMLT